MTGPSTATLLSRLVLLAAAALLAGRAASAQVCFGDCDGSTGVSLGEVQSGFNVFLGTAALDTCQAADINQSGEVSLGEVQAAFNDFLAGCGAASRTIESFVSQVGVVGFGSLANPREGDPPPPSGASAPSVQGSTMVVNGGSSQVTIESDDAFDTMFLSVQAGSGGGSGGISLAVSGFFELELPEAVNSVALLITTAQDVPLDSFSWVFQIVDEAGRVSEPASTPIEIIEVGTGDVQVSVSWDLDSDVDLHVVEPGGEEIYYAHTLSATGGTLDLDSNSGCFIDGVRNENVTWPSGQAPLGEYIVRVDYWNACQVAETVYVVTVQVTGREPMILRGRFTGEGDQGGLGDGVEVARFTF